MSERTPWPAWLQAAAQLGVSPCLFWRLSFREWRALVAPPAQSLLSRADFQALALRFPDNSDDRSPNR